ncbi:LuxR C-terminal-related transcriptional regulator [Christensenellaceae bacterium OttesenSCG-928-K19]|nr:LuxR C-terminal-related transcriptional regulator [Christensenellaceae bacterium OttesenSCG-928-K19]
MLKARDTIYIGIFFALVLVLWVVLTLLAGPKSIQLAAGEHAEYDLTEYSFEDTVYVASPVWESWPERLYSPEDLKNAEDSVPQDSLDYTNVQYVTHRLKFELPTGQTYGIALGSPDYSMRVYINGVEAGNIGVPGTTAEETIPKEQRAVYYFVPQSNTVEIVVQVANFVHRIGGNPPALTIGTMQNIMQSDTIAMLKIGLIFGCLLTAGLYQLAIFLLNRRQVSTLLFALPCLLQAFVSENIFSLFFPNLDWQIAIRLEYIFFTLAVAMLVLLIERLFPSALHKWVSRGYIVLCVVYMILVLASGTTFFIGLLPAFQVVCIAMAFYVFIRLAMQLKRALKNLLAFAGIVIVALFSINEMLVRNGVYIFGNMPGKSFGVSEGMVFFVLCYAVLLSIDQVEVNKRLEVERQMVSEAEARYESLLKKQGVRQMPQDVLSGLGLTKRESEVALLLIDGKSRDEIAGLLNISMGTVNFHCNNIYRKAGVSNVAELAKLMVYNDEREEGS